MSEIEKTGQEAVIEREARTREAFDGLVKKHQEARTESREAGPEWVENLIQGFPDSARADILAYDRELSEAGVPPEKRAKFLARKAESFEQTYIDRRFTFEDGQRALKDEFAKESAVMSLKELLDGEDLKLDTLGRVARFGFDANGLKAFNDLSGEHDIGTEYLKRIAEVLRCQPGPLRQRLEELGVKDILPTTGGGDEYSVMVKADQPLAPEVLAELTELMEQAVSDIDVSDLIDFQNLDVQLRYLGISKREYDGMDAARRQELQTRINKEITQGFKMRSSASGGAATLTDGLASAVEDPRGGKRLEDGDAYAVALRKIVGGLWDASDRIAVENKTRFKESLRAAEASPDDKFYSRVLARTTDVRILEQKLDDLNRGAKVSRQVETETQELIELMKTGHITVDAFVSAQAAIREKYKATE